MPILAQPRGALPRSHCLDLLETDSVASSQCMPASHLEEASVALDVFIILSYTFIGASSLSSVVALLVLSVYCLSAYSHGRAS